MLTITACLLSTFAVGQIPPLNPVATWTSGLEEPARVAVSGTEILVADLRANAIVRLDLAGAVLGSWSVPEGPVAVAVHPDGRIFVARRDDARVAIYDSSFVFQSFIDPVLAPFVKPTDLVVDSISGSLFVVDSGADRYSVFDSTGALTLVVGVRGERPSELKYPSAVAVDSATGRVYVADQDNFRVQVFDSAGVFLFRFGYRNKYLPGGLEEGWMPRSAALAVDGAGNIYITDAFMGTLRIFDSTGAELGKVALYGIAAGQLRNPGGVAIDATGRIIVANPGNGSVEVYDPPVIPKMAASTRSSQHGQAGYNLSEFDRLRGFDPLSAIQRNTSPLRATSPTSLGVASSASSASSSAPSSASSSSASASASSSGMVPLSTPGWEPPHMLDDTVCGRCHGMANPPGGHEGLVEGQENLCFSCHVGAGQGLADVIKPTANMGMTHAWGVNAVNPTFGSVGPQPGSPVGQHLDAGNIKCATCHNQHNNDAGSPLLRAPADEMCKECHADHVIHAPSGPWQPTCIECHTPHDPTHRNLSLVRGVIFNQTLGVNKDVVFTSRFGANSYDDGDPAALDGICQVCHTSTGHHLQDGSSTPHFDGQSCTSCHPHDNGFLPGGDCTGCHALPQGGRRAIVGEFPVGDAHAHYGAELNPDACLVCHSVDTHMNGVVELIDADTNALYSFQQPSDLASDPDLSDFCASCHDADGATRLATPMDPFGNGNAPPDVATRFKGSLQWNELYGDFCFGTEGTLRGVNSHHDISDADQAFSGAKIECLNCHGAHNASATQKLADPFDTHTAWSGGTSTFCLSCHNGGAGPQDPGWPAGVYGPTLPVDALRAQGLAIMDVCTNGTGDCSGIPGIDSCDYNQAPWWLDYSWSNAAHGHNSKRGWGSYSGAPEATIDCVVCHDPHGSYTDVNTTGNPYMIRDVVDGTAFVDDGYRVGSNWTGPPWDTFGTNGIVQVGISGTTVDWGNGLCVVCHADWLQAEHFHDYCTACQTCHGHGMSWGENDWGGGTSENTPCPTARMGARSAGENADGSEQPPIHLMAPEREGHLPSKTAVWKRSPADQKPAVQRSKK